MHYLWLILQYEGCEEVFTAWRSCHPEEGEGSPREKDGDRSVWRLQVFGVAGNMAAVESSVSTWALITKDFSGQQILGVQSRQANNDLCAIIFTLLCKKVSLGISLNPQWRIRPPKDQHIATTYWQEKVTCWVDGFLCLGLVQISQVNEFATTWCICTEDLVSCILFLHKS